MLLIPHTALYILPKLAPTNRESISQKEWCLRRRPLTSQHYLQPMLGALPQPFQWCLDHQLLSGVRPLVMPQIKRGKRAKEARALKVPRKEKSVAPLSSPQLRRPKQPGPNRRRVLPLGPQKNLKGSNHQKGRLSLVVECLEKALYLPKDMQELRSFRKREVFLSLKRNLAKVCNHFPLFMN